MSISRRSFLASAAAAPILASKVLRGAAAETPLVVYVGTYTGTTSKGIYAWQFVPSTGALTPLGVAAETPNPSFLALHPNGKFLYAANEVGNYSGQRSGSVSAFAIDARTSKLTLLNRVVSRGQNPAHLVVDPSGRWVVVANYGGEDPGTVAVLRIKPDGGLEDAKTFIPHKGSSVNPVEQNVAHPHGAVLSPDNKFLFVPDKGIDQIVQYRWDPQTGALTPNTPPFAATKAGDGPRHLAFGKSGKFAYACQELSSAVTAYAYDAAKGTLAPLATLSTLPKGLTVPNNTTAEIEVHPDGTFLYVSNRGHNSLALFAIDPKTGTLTAVDHTLTGGQTPRNFKIDPTGAYVFAANQASDKTTLFKIDRKTGRLTAAPGTLDAPMPVCIVFHM